MAIVTRRTGKTMVNNSMQPGAIPPVFVLSTGRCGSTMISDILNLHPRVLSLSEFFSFTGMASFNKDRRSGEWMWELFSEQQARTRLMLKEDFEEILYPFDRPDARFTRRDVPPIMCTTLPHLTEEHEALYDELEPVVKNLPSQRTSNQYRDLFDWMCRRFDRAVWAERSGGSLLSASLLLQHFPEARVVHVYRDGRDVALSMSRHYLFRMIAASLMALRRDPVDVMSLLPHEKVWKQFMMLSTPAVSNGSLNRPLPYQKLELQHFGSFWSRMIEHGNRVFSALPPDRLLSVRFEDLQEDPEGQIRRLIRFISPELDDRDWLRKASSIPRPTASCFPDLTPHEQDTLTESCRPGLELLGYRI